jgi:hypothetical protein
MTNGLPSATLVGSGLVGSVKNPDLLKDPDPELMVATPTVSQPEGQIEAGEK